MSLLRRLFLIFLLSFLILQFLFVNIELLKIPSYDYAFFHRVGDRVFSHQNPYSANDTQPLRYPPTTLLIFSFLSIFPLIESQFIFFFISFIIFLTGSVVLFNSVEKLDGGFFKKIGYFEVLLTYFIFVLLFFPFRYLLSSLHIHSLTFLLFTLVIYFLLTKRDYLAGLSLAIAGSITITPLLLLVIFLIQKKLNILYFTLINLIFIALITVFFLGQDIYSNFLQTTSDSLDFGITSYYNQSAAAFLSRIIPDQDVVKKIIVAILITCTGVYIILNSKIRSASKDSNLISWLTGILLSLLFAPFSWQYHFILTLIPFVFLFYIFKKYNFSRYYKILLFASYILVGLNIKNPDIKLPMGLDLFVLTHVFWGGIILLCLSFYTLKKLTSRG